MKRAFAAFTASVLISSLAPPEAHARITKIVLTVPGIPPESPAFGGESFGAAGQFEKLVGTAYGEVDPNDPHDAVIQDLALAPRNARGMVEYSTDVYVLKPIDMRKGNGMLLYAVANRGAKGGIPFNIGVRSVNQLGQIVAGGNDPFDPGDGFLQKMGYTVVWSGWQPDVLPGNGRMTAVVPVARIPDGTPEGFEITGIVRSEISLGEGATAAQVLPVNLSAGRFTLQQEATYEPVDISTATLTQRRHVNDPRVPIDRISPDGKPVWSFLLPCGRPPPGTHLQCQIRLAGGFQPGVLYELIYTARNPTVLGLGWAAQRDLVSFFKYARHDDFGHPNPLFLGRDEEDESQRAALRRRDGEGRRGDDEGRALAVVQGISQSGRAIRTFLHLGFNEDEQGRIVFEGAFPQIGGGRVAMNVRFATPARGWGYSIDHLYPAYEFPFSYMPTHDPITRQTGGVLKRCLETETCPKIFHVASALELWEGRQSLGFTDTLGKRDLGEPGFIRHYIMASTEHSPPAFDPVKGPTFADCEQQQNPNPQTETLRALWVAFTDWVKDGVQPPPSSAPRVKDGTLVRAADLIFPSIPPNDYPNQSPAGPTPRPLGARPRVRFEHLVNELRVLDFGPGFDARDESGIISVEVPAERGEAYGVLVPQIDADGNDVAGIRSVTLRAPLATYTGWNMGRPDRTVGEVSIPGRFGDGLCPLSGSYIPFPPTEAERLANGDPRPSIQARYGDHAGYVAAVRAAAAELVAERFLLPEDAERLIGEAEAGGVLR